MSKNNPATQTAAEAGAKNKNARFSWPKIIRAPARYFRRVFAHQRAQKQPRENSQPRFRALSLPLPDVHPHKRGEGQRLNQTGNFPPAMVGH